jgi:nucleoredoxin
MTNRCCAGILCVLVLTIPFIPLARAADEAAAVVGKVAEVEAVEKTAGGAEQAPESKIDLARDLTNKLVLPDGMEFKPHRLAEAQKIDYYLVYFGAHWCPSCKKFTPKLTEFYREQRAEHRNFEVIFVSADKDEGAMLQFMNGYKMPWPAVKFGEHKNIESIKALAGRGYPCVALVDAKGEIVAHSYGEDCKGDYVGPLKPVEMLKEILEGKIPKASSKSVARTGR